MSEELKTSEELAAEAETSAAETPETTETAAPEEPTESMADYAEELEASFKQIHEGDILTGTVIGVSESEITLDLKYYTEGIIRLEDFTSDPGFNLKEDVHVGDEISATVIRRDDGEGHILLSSKEANDILAWDKFKKYMEEGTNLTVKVGGIVKSGVVAYLDGIRGSLDDYTWDQLQEISLKIKAAETRSEAREIAKRYHLLDDNGHIPYPCTKRVTLTNELQVGAQLVGIRHDELLDGTGKAGLTFMFDAGIAERNATAEPPSAGWADCELREWLNGDGLKLLPNELRALIKSVKKISNNVGAANSASCLSELPATLWLPAMVELCGTQPPYSFAKDYHYLADIYNGEGKEYQLFRELKVSPYSTNETMVRQWKGKDTCWWERTVSPDTSESEGTLYMNRVGHDGDAFTYATPAEKPNKLTCVIPGFCI